MQLKIKSFFSILFILFLSTPAFAKVATSAQEIRFATETISKILVDSNYTLVEDSIELNHRETFSVINGLYNYTYGFLTTDAEGDIYDISFLVTDGKVERNGRVQLFTRGGISNSGQKYNSTQKEITNPITRNSGIIYLSIGLLSEKQMEQVTAKNILE